MLSKLLLQLCLMIIVARGNQEGVGPISTAEGNQNATEPTAAPNSVFSSPEIVIDLENKIFEDSVGFNGDRMSLYGFYTFIKDEYNVNGLISFLNKLKEEFTGFIKEKKGVDPFEIKSIDDVETLLSEPYDYIRIIDYYSQELFRGNIDINIGLVEYYNARIAFFFRYLVYRFGRHDNINGSQIPRDLLNTILQINDLKSIKLLLENSGSELSKEALNRMLNDSVVFRAEALVKFLENSRRISFMHAWSVNAAWYSAQYVEYTRLMSVLKISSMELNKMVKMPGDAKKNIYSEIQSLKWQVEVFDPKPKNCASLDDDTKKSILELVEHAKRNISVFNESKNQAEFKTAEFNYSIKKVKEDAFVVKYKTENGNFTIKMNKVDTSSLKTPENATSSMGIDLLSYNLYSSSLHSASEVYFQRSYTGEANKTIEDYFLVIYEDWGTPLLEYITQQQISIDEAFVKRMVTDVLNGSAYLHSEGLFYHRIDHGNILVNVEESDAGNEYSFKISNLEDLTIGDRLGKQESHGNSAASSMIDGIDSFFEMLIALLAIQNPNLLNNPSIFTFISDWKKVKSGEMKLEDYLKHEFLENSKEKNGHQGFPNSYPQEIFEKPAHHAEITSYINTTKFRYGGEEFCKNENITTAEEQTKNANITGKDPHSKNESVPEMLEKPWNYPHYTVFTGDVDDSLFVFNSVKRIVTPEKYPDPFKVSNELTDKLVYIIAGLVIFVFAFALILGFSIFAGKGSKKDKKDNEIPQNLNWIETTNRTAAEGVYSETGINKY